MNLNLLIWVVESDIERVLNRFEGFSTRETESNRHMLCRVFHQGMDGALIILRDLTLIRKLVQNNEDFLIAFLFTESKFIHCKVHCGFEAVQCRLSHHLYRT